MKNTNKSLLPFIQNDNINQQQYISQLKFEIENLKSEFEEYKKKQFVTTVNNYNGMTVTCNFSFLKDNYYKLEWLTITNINNLTIGDRTVIAEYKKPTLNSVIDAPIAIRNMYSLNTNEDMAFTIIYLVNNQIVGSYNKTGKETSPINGNMIIHF